MRRREFIKSIGGAVIARPLAARAQQAPKLPVVGLLSSRAPGDVPQLVAAVRRGLQDTGFVEGHNVVIEYRFAGNHNEQLPALAADLVQRQVTVIAATTTPAALAAKAATTTILIVFEIGGDPVRFGLVARLNRPGGNATGGPMSYGSIISEAYYLTGVYAGRILKGERPGELPVQQSTKVEMFLNLKTANTLGITVPLPLLGRADEVIE